MAATAALTEARSLLVSFHLMRLRVFPAGLVAFGGVLHVRPALSIAVGSLWRALGSVASDAAAATPPPTGHTEAGSGAFPGAVALKITASPPGFAAVGKLALEAFTEGLAARGATMGGLGEMDVAATAPVATQGKRVPRPPRRPLRVFNIHAVGEFKRGRRARCSRGALPLRAHAHSLFRGAGAAVDWEHPPQQP